MLCAEEWTRQVDIDDPLPVLDRKVLQRRGRDVDAGVVEEQVEPAKGLVRCLERHVAGVGAGDVGGGGLCGRNLV